VTENSACYEYEKNAKLCEPLTSIYQFNPARNVEEHTVKSGTNSLLFAQVAMKNPQIILDHAGALLNTLTGPIQAGPSTFIGATVGM